MSQYMSSGQWAFSFSVSGRVGGPWTELGSPCVCLVSALRSVWFGMYSLPLWTLSSHHSRNFWMLEHGWCICLDVRETSKPGPGILSTYAKLDSLGTSSDLLRLFLTSMSWQPFLGHRPLGGSWDSDGLCQKDSQILSTPELNCMLGLVYWAS